MEEEEIVLEDGEIASDSDSNESHTYTPLERPANYSAAQPNTRFPVIQDDDSESGLEFQSSDSGSDSDSNSRMKKKPKIKLKPKLQTQQPKQKKYDIWSTRVQEDVLADTLNNCDVTTKDRSRESEAYDYGRALYSKRFNNKRSRDDRKNPHFKSTGRSDSSEKVNGTSRTILDLAVTADGSLEEVAKDIANKLCEEKEDLIYKVLDAVGKEKCFSIFKETQRIEEEGGMLIMNQTRRRTPGGVFFFLVRHANDINLEQKDKIFGEEKQKHKITQKLKEKMKHKKQKEQIRGSKAQLLPELPTRAELLARESNRNRKKTEEKDIINPPPTPETDGGHENSGDGMDSLNSVPMLSGSDDVAENSRRKIQTYDEDFLEIGCSSEMDLF